VELQGGEWAEGVLGRAWLRTGSPAQALAHLEKAPAEGAVLVARVQACLEVGSLTEAEGLAKKTPAPLELKPLAATVATLAARRDRLRKEAGAKWDAALDRCVCAEHAYAEGRVTQAETLLAGAFADGVELAPAYGLRSLLAVEKGRLERALTAAERALALGEDGRALYVRGRVRLERGTAGALADLEKAARLTEEKDADVLQWLAMAYAQANRPADAVAAQRKAVKLRTADTEFAELLRQYEKQSGTP
jgi:tetratricopeptide (TPR) repeat protein